MNILGIGYVVCYTVLMQLGNVRQDGQQYEYE